MEKLRKESKEAGELIFEPLISFALSVRDMVSCEKKNADAKMLRSGIMGTFMGFRCAFLCSPLPLRNACFRYEDV